MVLVYVLLKFHEYIPLATQSSGNSSEQTLTPYRKLGQEYRGWELFHETEVCHVVN